MISSGQPTPVCNCGLAGDGESIASLTGIEKNLLPYWLTRFPGHELHTAGSAHQAAALVRGAAGKGSVYCAGFLPALAYIKAAQMVMRQLRLQFVVSAVSTGLGAATGFVLVPRFGLAGAAMTERYPNAGMGVALQIGAKVAKGEMTWG